MYYKSGHSSHIKVFGSALDLETGRVVVISLETLLAVFEWIASVGQNRVLHRLLVMVDVGLSSWSSGRRDTVVCVHYPSIVMREIRAAVTYSGTDVGLVQEGDFVVSD